MAINDDVKWLYSGNGTAQGSLGGAISAIEIVTSQNENLFQNIADPVAAESQYFCVYLKNTGIITYAVEMFISTPTPSKDTSVFIGNGTSAVNGVEQIIADRNTEPSGATWLQRHFDYNAVSIATLAPNDTKAIWLRLDQLANAGGSLTDYCRIQLKG